MPVQICTCRVRFGAFSGRRNACSNLHTGHLVRNSPASHDPLPAETRNRVLGQYIGSLAHPSPMSFADLFGAPLVIWRQKKKQEFVTSKYLLCCHSITYFISPLLGTAPCGFCYAAFITLTCRFWVRRPVQMVCIHTNSLFALYSYMILHL